MNCLNPVGNYAAKWDGIISARTIGASKRRLRKEISSFLQYRRIMPTLSFGILTHAYKEAHEYALLSTKWCHLQLSSAARVQFVPQRYRQITARVRHHQRSARSVQRPFAPGRVYRIQFPPDIEPTDHVIAHCRVRCVHTDAHRLRFLPLFRRPPSSAISGTPLSARSSKLGFLVLSARLMTTTTFLG